MSCVWSSLIKTLPLWIRQNVSDYFNEDLQEIRLRLGLPPEFIKSNTCIKLSGQTTVEDLVFCINAASQYSPWSAATISKGFITIKGGHRLGVCGQIRCREGSPSDFSCVSSICIRVAKEVIGVSKELWKIPGSILIIGKPGSGKTTLLRDLIYQKSKHNCGEIGVVDERMELFPIQEGTFCFSAGRHTDVLSGCDKNTGIEMLIRNMNPAFIAVDEITAAKDCDAMLRAGWCGVNLIATAHASGYDDLLRRRLYKPLIESNLFDALVIMGSDKTWTVERMR